MSAEHRAFRASEQLQAACAAEGLPSRIRDLGQQVQRQLKAPVRLALVGRPGSGKVALVNGFVGAAALPQFDNLPPMILTHGPEASILVTTDAGQELPVEDSNLSSLNEDGMALIRITAPLPLLEKISLLTVPLEENAEDNAAALAWTARHADVVLWCTKALTAEEEKYWRHLPPPLCDHAFLAILRDPPPPETRHMTRHFRSVNYIGTKGVPIVHERRTIDRDALGRLRATLLSHVSSGRLEDLEGALIFLERYMPRRRYMSDLPTGTAEIGSPETPAPGQSQTGPATNGIARPKFDLGTALGIGKKAAPLTEGKAAAYETLTYLIERAHAVAELLNDEPARPEAVLAHCTETLDTCIDRAGACRTLNDFLTEATDLMLLMQLEATPAAMSDSIALLLQVRRECEQLLTDDPAVMEALEAVRLEA